MKAVADLVNLSIASLYVAMVGVGCVPTSFSFFHIASLLVRQGAKHYQLLSREWSNTAKISLPEGYPDSEDFQTISMAPGSRCVRRAGRTWQRCVRFSDDGGRLIEFRCKWRYSRSCLSTRPLPEAAMIPP